MSELYQVRNVQDAINAIESYIDDIKADLDSRTVNAEKAEVTLERAVQLLRDCLDDLDWDADNANATLEVTIRCFINAVT